jgi:ABC-type Fe3+ transport system substrate-binding protein
VNRAFAVVCAVLSLLVAPALAQAPAFIPDAVDLAAAKREGTLTWYTSTPVATAQNIADAFRAETGIKVAIIKGSPHPNAAKAFAEFMIGDTVQRLFPGEGIYAARSDVEPPPGSPPIGQIKLMPVDCDQVEREGKALKTRFNEIYQ